MAQSDSFYAATVSEALRIAMGGDAHAPIGPAAQPVKYVPGPAIRPVAEAFAMAFTSCAGASPRTVPMPKRPAWHTATLSELRTGR